MAEHFDCPSCGGPITDDEWIQVDVSFLGPDPERRSLLSRDRYHRECWAVMTEVAEAEARRVPE